MTSGGMTSLVCVTRRSPWSRTTTVMFSSWRRRNQLIQLMKRSKTCLVVGERTNFEQDAPAPYPQPSLYRILHLLADVNAPTPEVYPEDCPPRSPTTEAALQSCPLDWVVDVEQVAPSQPELEEVTVEEERHHDPCLPSPLCEPIPQEGCSEQRFEQESSQSEPDLREECFREMERTVCHLDTSNTFTGQDSNTQEAGHHCLGICGQRMLAD